MAASHFQQQALVRKLSYTVTILVLLTVSLLHRRLVIEKTADDLLLREKARGEVELTGSAIRLTLTGSRGLAVTILWAAAIKTQEKHEWNELELLVSSITRLQPYFITPWLFQSWNMAFNVSVECDRPRDKYYYISRGLDMLAEGERRNTPQPVGNKPPAPGNPDMRHYIGFFHQMKIGKSDETNTMRCLLEMSCIDPVRRAPERLWEPNKRGKEVNLAAFAEFCKKHPRLVRRLREQMVGYEEPQHIVKFLDDNRDIPSRFQKIANSDQLEQTPLEKDERQFPILPPRRWSVEKGPDPGSPDLTSETIDVFLITRTWYQYAQEPLPPPHPDASEEKPFDPLKFRKNRYMAITIFRQYPTLAQRDIALALQEEGFFDEEGWVIKGWFDKPRDTNYSKFVVGAEAKYHGGPSWEKTYQAMLDFGRKNGLVFSPGEHADLERKAALYRKEYVTVEKDPGIPSHKRGTPVGDSYRAHLRLKYALIDRGMTGFDPNFLQAMAERQPETVLARKLLFRAERDRRFDSPYTAPEVYERAFPLLAKVMISNPQFAQQSDTQEGAWMLQYNYLKLAQENRPELFKPLALGMAQWAVWPHPDFRKLLTPRQEKQVLPIRNAGGLLDRVIYYDAKDAEPLKMALTAIAHGLGTGTRFIYPGEHHLMLRGNVVQGVPVAHDQEKGGWRRLVDENNAQAARQQLAHTTPQESKAAEPKGKESKGPPH